jgi:hypothetical protein
VGGINEEGGVKIDGKIDIDIFLYNPSLNYL